MSRSGRRKKLRLESLESRQLMAGDIHAFSHDTITDRSEIIEPFFAQEQTFSQADAGSSRNTAARIGAVDGTRNLSGSLGWFDRSDVIEFSIARDADASVQLSGLRRDADLYLTDASGRIVAQSTRSGRANDAFSARLDGGNYFVFVVARSYWSTNYQLAIQTQLDPIILPPSESVVTSPQTGNTASDNAPLNSVSPLADVAYFGGSRDWNVNAVNAPEAWAAGYTGQGITVAVVDTGVDLDHPDLVTNLFVNPGEIAGNGIDDDGNGYIDDVSGYDFADNDNNANDVGGHGTHVAGTIAAANNGFGATGIAPDATILPVRVLGANGSGSTLDVAAGIRYAADLGADIINLSLGGGYSRAIDAAIEYAKSLGSLIVAAAGNESSSVPGYPARFSASDNNVISVGAFSSSSRLAGFSNDVGTSGAVQVDAPGVGIYSTYVGGRYASLSGTSMASPHVAGLAALTLSANPNLTSPELRSLLSEGVQGNAVGSDAIGKASASQTVAYAAAGLTGSDLAQSNTQQSRRSNGSARIARATGSFLQNDSPQAPPIKLATINDDARDLSFEVHVDIHSTTPQSPIASYDVSNRPTTRTLESVTDEFFSRQEVSIEEVEERLA